MTKDGTLVACRGGRAQLNHDDHGGSYGNRGDRVEDDAEGAVVGVRLERMDVRDLGDSKESQQDEA